LIAKYRLTPSERTIERHDLPQVLHRVFPVARGLYEDKVANVWCAISPVLKLRALLPQPTLVRLALLCVVLASTPALIGIWRRPTPARLLAAMCAVSNAFFLFGFQVHEKSVLLPLMPACALLALDWRAHAHWAAPYHALANFSMWPLLRRDGQTVPYAVLTVAWIALTCTRLPGPSSGKAGVWWRALYVLLAAACLALHALEMFVVPPSRFPDLWVLANQSLSCAGFVGVWIMATRAALGH